MKLFSFISHHTLSTDKIDQCPPLQTVVEELWVIDNLGIKPGRYHTKKCDKNTVLSKKLQRLKINLSPKPLSRIVRNIAKYSAFAKEMPVPGTWVL